MTINGWLQIALFSVIVILITRPFGGYMTRVFAGERPFSARFCGPVERAVYWCCGVDEKEEQHWLTYAVAVLFFSVVGFLSLYALQRLQWYLPFNPQGQTGVEPSSAFNTSVSFVTNTNWQSYVPETTMGYLVQMAGLTVHNFVSAATGIALALALIRGFARREAKTIGNFWVDLTRCTLYVLLPISIVVGARSGLAGRAAEPGRLCRRDDARRRQADDRAGPGRLAGGHQGARHEWRRVLQRQLGASVTRTRTPLTNLIELVAIFAIGAGADQCPGPHGQGRAPGLGDLRRDGHAVPRRRDDRLLVGSRTAILPSPPSMSTARRARCRRAATWRARRCGSAPRNSALWATVTTDTSCGAVNSMHDSFLPIGGMVPLVNMQLGEVIFGGVGSGLYGMLAFAIVAMFVAGLMVGRTPEYLGKKLEAKEVKMTILALLCLPLSILGWTALATVVPAGLAGIANTGPHGFSEILYAYTAGTGNNGSAFAGLSANTLFYNTTIGFAMLIGRFIMVIPLLAVAGSLAQKKLLAPSAGTFPTNRPLFVGLLVGVVLIIGGLTLFPGDIARAGGRAGRDEPGQALPGAVRAPLPNGQVNRHSRESGNSRNPRAPRLPPVPCQGQAWTAAFAGVTSKEDIHNDRYLPIMIGSPETGLYKRQLRPLSIFDRSLIVPAIWASFRKLDPRTLVKNPVMFCVEIVSVLTTIFFLRDLIVGGGTVVGHQRAAFSGQITLWLWFTVLFANFAEAVAEGRGKAQADALRRTRTETKAKAPAGRQLAQFRAGRRHRAQAGDLVLVEAGDLIPSDGEVIEGVASVDESAITGESAPVIRESGGDRSAVTGGTRVTSDWLGCASPRRRARPFSTA